ncbi:MAG: helix-hairpin-helix domain-containing protein, partial [Candidatus Pacebacteria bacterium]|nr:helix-hairpin-helix domain-containing protein [Candidatus Paceibacterota bacterium]
MVNQELAGIFYELAFYLEMENIPFKPQAYRKAALFLESLNQDAEDIYRREGKEGLEKIPGVGKGMAQKIIEYLKTGKISEYEKFKKKIPVNLKELTSIEGIGPKAVRDLYKYLKIKNLAQLEQAALKGKIRKLPNFGEKSEKNILEAVNFIKKSQGRFFLDEAWRLADKIVFQLESLKEVEKVSVAGSLRRMKETIGDIDLLATIKKKVLVSEALAKEGNKKIMDVFTRLDGVIKIWDYGFKKSFVRFYEGIDVDLRVVTSNESGSALQYFTGSKEHNIITRKLALEKGLKLNEYGVFKGKKRVAGKTEEEIYKIIGLPYIEPELRENTGEIEAGLKNQLPKIIGYNEIKGDLHCHSDWDGGEDSME